MKAKSTLLIVMLAVSSVSALGQSSISGQIFINPALTYTRTNTLGSVLTESIGFMLSDTIANGTNPAVSSPQMNALIRYNDTLTKNGEAILNLNDITNSFGEVKGFTRILFIGVKTATNTSIAFGPDDSIGPEYMFMDRADDVFVGPGSVFAYYSPDGVVVSNNYGMFVVSNRTPEVDSLYSQGGLNIDTVTTKFKTTNTINYSLGGTNTLTKTATTNLAFSSSDTINVAGAEGDYYGAWRVQINPAGTISTKAIMTNQAYASLTNAVASLPAADSMNISIGYIAVLAPTASVFTAGTTALTTNNSWLVDSATNAPTTAAFGIVIGGVATNHFETESDKEVLSI